MCASKPLDRSDWPDGSLFMKILRLFLCRLPLRRYSIPLTPETYTLFFPV